MTQLSGKEFNDKYPNIEFYETMGKDCKLNNFKYQHGLNVLPVDSQNKLVFCTLNMLPQRINIRYSVYIVKVTIPLDAQVYVNQDFPSFTKYIPKVSISPEVFDQLDVHILDPKPIIINFTTDQFVLDLNNKVLIDDFYIWKNEELCKQAILQKSYLLHFVKHQTEDLCKYASSNFASVKSHLINLTSQQFASENPAF